MKAIAALLMVCTILLAMLFPKFFLEELMMSINCFFNYFKVILIDYFLL